VTDSDLRSSFARVPGPSIFVACGALAVLAVRVRGFDLFVHVRVLVAVAALLGVGTFVDRFVFRTDGARGPAHRIVLGQAALLVYFYARSALGHAVGAPGIARWELYAIAIVASVFAIVRRRAFDVPNPAGIPARAAVWLAWWASTFTFLGYRSGRLEPPASDPDLQTLWARLTAEHGYLIYDLLPVSRAPVDYPSGFSALNALWIDLTGATPVEIVNCQIALQACLAVLLVVEMVAALRRGQALATSLVLLAVAHWAFSFPVNAMMAHFEGTARLSHSALLIFPLTLAALLPQERSAGATRAVWLAGAFCVAWAAALNPSHVAVEIPILLAAGLLSLRHLARGSWAPLGALGVAALLLASDAWLRTQLQRGGAAAARGAPDWTAAVRAGFERAGIVSLAHVLPYRCIPSAQCSSFVVSAGPIVVIPAIALALGLLAARRKEGERAARAVLAIVVALWLAAFLSGFVPALAAATPGLNGSLLRSYSENGLTFSTALLDFALIAASVCLFADLAAMWRPSLSPWTTDAIAGALALASCAVPVALQPSLLREVTTAYSRHVRLAPLTALGPILPEDVRVARAAARLVAPGEKMLLPGVVKQMNEWELWYFTLGGARAIPLYTDVPFASFHDSGSAAREYRDHVCDRLDLPWLAERHIVWIYESAQVQDWACVRGWGEARTRYFDLALRDGRAALWRVRADRLAQAGQDPVLGRQERDDGSR
jgi:hypothetical protein